MATKSTINKQLLDLCKDNQILFLENDYGLHNSVGEFYKWTVENKIRTHALFNISALPFEYIEGMIDWYDLIVFETQWVYEISERLKKHISELKSKKTILECYTGQPTWSQKPDVIHDVYILNSGNDDMKYWKLHQLKKDKHYWKK